ncbi:MAG: hypothetical protein DWQ31_03810 [Planctomycetota bacterium]|nr:MAG: hypothetical protein DWQ31_03810 [Planctomycetota bacterium]REJ94099.1 MAG: hypothetical protein DWQ35_08730 [Planctomycetota bacterium]REK26285.1 MAG: hypothetical protein DWQ42_09320 [Planctomycetota bacterium]REK45836.1 MAG: hypothetical protein DWQ46_08035 [Planctomycetota bacterium]
MNRDDLEDLMEEYSDDSQAGARPKPQRTSSQRFSKQRRRAPLGIRGRSNFRSVSSSEKRSRLSG